MRGGCDRGVRGSSSRNPRILQTPPSTAPIPTAPTPSTARAPPHAARAPNGPHPTPPEVAPQPQTPSGRSRANVQAALPPAPTGPPDPRSPSGQIPSQIPFDPFSSLQIHLLSHLLPRRLLGRLPPRLRSGQASCGLCGGREALWVGGALAEDGRVVARDERLSGGRGDQP